jgi:hypothetical protein
MTAVHGVLRDLGLEKVSKSEPAAPIAQLNQAKAQAQASRSQVSQTQAQAAQGNAAVDGANQPEPYCDRSADRRRGDSAQCGRGPDLVSVMQNSGD